MIQPNVFAAAPDFCVLAYGVPNTRVVKYFLQPLFYVLNFVKSTHISCPHTVTVGREGAAAEGASSNPQAQSDGPYRPQRRWPPTAGCTRAMGCSGQVDLRRCMGQPTGRKPSSQVPNRLRYDCCAHGFRQGCLVVTSDLQTSHGHLRRGHTKICHQDTARGLEARMKPMAKEQGCTKPSCPRK